jgi:hypothetical protein
MKDLPPLIAVREYEVLRRMEELGLPAVRPAGLVVQPDFDTAILVTQYLDGSWQYRRLLMRLPPDQPTHRARLFDAMANLLVERCCSIVTIKRSWLIVAHRATSVCDCAGRYCRAPGSRPRAGSKNGHERETNALDIT